MAVTPSELRANIYRLIDAVVETGIPLQIVRGDTRLELSLADTSSKLSRLPLRPLFDCEPDELIGAHRETP